jgi:hypothetical protein
VNAQPGEEPVKPRDWFALGDIAQLTNKTAISASQKASAAPIATVLAARGPVFLSAPIASVPRAIRSGGLNMSNSRIHSAGIDMPESRKISMRMICYPIRIPQRRARRFAAI